MKKIKTLIVIDNLETGGIASSLLNYLHYAKDKLDVDLLVFDEKSVEGKNLPENVRVVKAPSCLAVLGVSQQDLKSRSKGLAFFRAIFVGISRLISGQFARKLLFLFTKKMKGYDLAISYAHDNGWKSLSKGCNDFVVRRVSAKRKAVFMHCDYKNYGGYDKRQEKILNGMDNVICVAESCRKNFVEVFPGLAAKTLVCENFINVADINRKTEEYYEYQGDETVFISVCRLSKAKGLQRALEGFARLYREGRRAFRWYIVGGGPEYENLQSGISAAGLENNVLLLGEKSNPFYYMKKANVFLLTSYQEAAPMVFGEAATLQLPILTTETCSARELVGNREIGLVCENNDEAIYQSLRKILCDKDALKGIRRMTEEEINENANEQLERFLENCK